MEKGKGECRSVGMAKSRADGSAKGEVRAERLGK
jgi:hypothetical protein